MKNNKPKLTIRRSTRFTEQEEKAIMQYAKDNEITYSAALRKLALESLYK
ncbi:hypothetical protein [Priestia aryabhattai]|nr:hypothetical protein [Priestia aryabhattai]WKG30185.1 hypothetical protein QYS54_23945 [Priestia aryabhattai]